ncbi:hypothetical protein ABIA24_002527 [Sinorhizobium fredii]|uniref:hypothetical protein n=1 Tax=Rhizobium fredii TaxID=380 RepID=UPI003514D8FB
MRIDAELDAAKDVARRCEAPSEIGNREADRLGAEVQPRNRLMRRQPRGEFFDGENCHRMSRFDLSSALV